MSSVKGSKTKYGHAILVTAPSVPYKVTWRDGREEIVSNPINFPDDSERKAKVNLLEEPMVKASFDVPKSTPARSCNSAPSTAATTRRLLPPTASAIRSVQMTYRLPLSEIVTDFFDKLKSCSSGFASFEYSEDGYAASDLVKLNFLISNTVLDSLSIIMHRSKVMYNARQLDQEAQGYHPETAVRGVDPGDDG